MKKLLFMSPQNYAVRKIDIVDISNYIFQKINEIIPRLTKREIFGSSPPEVFVGRFGYPKVFVGPVVPPFTGDTTSLVLTETWFGKNLEEIIEMRLKAIRGKYLIEIDNVDSKYALELHDMILSRKSVDSEVIFKRPPKGLRLSFDHQPFGPSGYLEYFRAYPGSSDFKLERAYYDTDLKAHDAVLELYFSGEPVSRIQQALSAGMLGTSRYRKFVPTRWSITAVDDMISKYLLKEVRQYPIIDTFRTYYLEYLDNRWIILLIPTAWEYESIEAFLPGTLDDRYVAIGGDYEPYKGRTTYASIGGCYYSARLAITEKLFKEKKQAAALVLREAHPGYKVPVGVWNVRESVRNALRRDPYKFETVKEVLDFISSKMALPIEIWIQHSYILKKLTKQKTLFDLK